MIVVDTSIILAYMNAVDDHHDVVSAWLESIDEDLATTALIIAEVDHLVGARGGPVAQRALRSDLARGAYLVKWWTGAITSVVNVADEYADMGLGLADASLVALAGRLVTLDLATLDERHFRAVRPLTGGSAFRLLPADA